MSIYISAVEASGRAICRKCKKLIKKGTIQITAYGYRTGGSICYNCLSKDIDDINNIKIRRDKMF